MKLLKKTSRIIEILYRNFRPSTIFVLPIALAILVFFFISTYKIKDLVDDKTINIIFIIAVLVSIILIFLIRFLNTDKEKDDLDTRLNLVREQLKEKKFEEQLKDALSNNPNILNVEDNVYKKVINGLQDSLVNELEVRFKKSIGSKYISNAIDNKLLPLTNNIERYINRIQRNSVVNLAIGIIGTIASISILAFSISSDQTYNEITIFLFHFLPKITFAIFIQLFAFFFLRLYKNNLEDAKYFQNELTNISAKSSALRIAYLLQKDTEVAEIIKDLSNTERNFKLLKDETLLNIEKAKIEKDFDLETLNALQNFLQAYKKEKK